MIADTSTGGLRVFNFGIRERHQSAWEAKIIESICWTSSSSYKVRMCGRHGGNTHGSHHVGQWAFDIQCYCSASLQSIPHGNQNLFNTVPEINWPSILILWLMGFLINLPSGLTHLTLKFISKTSQMVNHTRNSAQTGVSIQTTMHCYSPTLLCFIHCPLQECRSKRVI